MCNHSDILICLKCKLQSQPPLADLEEAVQFEQDGQHNEVETELYIGCPGRGRINLMLQN